MDQRQGRLPWKKVLLRMHRDHLLTTWDSPFLCHLLALILILLKTPKISRTSIHGRLGSKVGEEEAEPTTTSTGLARERRLLLNHHHLWTPFSLDLHYLFCWWQAPILFPLLFLLLVVAREMKWWTRETIGVGRVWESERASVCHFWWPFPRSEDTCANRWGQGSSIQDSSPLCTKWCGRRSESA